ncbi:MAG: SRPBCC family protein [Thermoleophilaceae bacterium]
MATLAWESLIAAPPETVWEVLTDHRGYADITPVRRVDLEREGQPAPNGVGAVRVLRLAGPPIREEVIEFDAPRRFSYRLLSGAPVRDHVGAVTLEPVPQGTRMSYRVDTTPTLPLAGAAVVGVFRLAVGRLVSGVVRESERRAAAAR